MRDHYTYDYAIIRLVPKVEREEFVNVGVIIWCQSKEFLDARIELDAQRLNALDSTLDIETIRTHLATIALFVLVEIREDRLANYLSGSVFTGSLHLEAPSSRRRLSTPVIARAQPQYSSICLTRWCERPAPHKRINNLRVRATGLRLLRLLVVTLKAKNFQLAVSCRGGI